MRLGTITTIMLLTASLVAAGEPASNEQLQADLQQALRRIDQQQRQLNEMQTALGQNWLDDARREQVRQLVREVLADAETRSSLLDSNVTAGHDGSFFIASDDNNFLLRLKGMVQGRYVFNRRNDSGADDTQSGFEDCRTRFSFSGHVVDPTWQFMIWTGHNCNGAATLLDVWVKKTLGEGWSVTAGQFKIPMFREWLVSETKQQFVERSLINALFSGSYTQGLKVDYGNDIFRGTLAFTDGLGAINTAWNTVDSDYAFTGRGELLLAGDWKQYAEFESWTGEQFMAVVGAAAHYQMGEYGTTVDEAQIIRWTVDGTLEFGGVNLFAAVVGSQTNNGVDLDQIGVLVQGGVFLTEKLEVIARYEWGDADSATDPTLSVLTVGANYFFAKHQLRLTADVSYAFDSVGAAWASSTAGYLPDGVGEEGQVVVRTQIQLVF